MYLRVTGTQSGPYTTDEVSRGYLEGDLEGRTMSWCDGEERWISLASRWPSGQPKSHVGVGAGIAVIAAGAAFAMSETQLKMLPFSLQTGPVLWCSVIGSLCVAGFGLQMACRGRRRINSSILVVALSIEVAAVGLWSLAMTGVSYPVLQMRQQAPNATVTFNESLNLIRVQGHIGGRLMGQLHGMFNRHPEAKGVVLDSPGGLVDDALAAARLVRKHGLVARVDGICASACVAIWSASPSRQMTATSRLGLHQVRLNLRMAPQIVGAAKADLNQKYDRLLRSAGFSNQVIARQNRTPPADMYWLDAVQAINAGVDVTVLDANGMPISVTMAKWLWVGAFLEKNTPIHKIMNNIRQHEALIVAKDADGLYRAFKSNDASAVRNTVHSLVADALHVALRRASDGAIVTWTRSLHGMLSHAIATHDVFTCAYISGGSSPSQASSSELKAFVSTELTNLGQLVESSGRKGMDKPLSASDRVIGRAVAQRTWSDAMKRGYSANTNRWSTSQKCGYVDNYYSNALRLSTHQSAQAVRWYVLQK